MQETLTGFLLGHERADHALNAAVAISLVAPEAALCTQEILVEPSKCKHLGGSLRGHERVDHALGAAVVAPLVAPAAAAFSIARRAHAVASTSTLPAGPP